jgi:hypothetical protein
MALIDELKEKRAEAIAALETQQEFVRAHQINVIDWRHMVEDLDRAIAALEPAEPLPMSDEAITDEQPELFEASVALEQLETDHALPPSADDVDVDEPVEFISDLTGDPAVEPESGLHETPDDEAQRAAAIELTADVEPVAASWIDQQTCEPVDATLRAFQDDHIVEPEPTEGYAPVTNPEADFWSRGLAPAEPEKKHRFSIFGHKRETEDA